VLVATVGILTLLAAEPRVLVRERRLLALHRVPRGPLFAAPLGAAFALGWTPCIGPVLAGLLAAAAASPTAGTGAALLGCTRPGWRCRSCCWPGRSPTAVAAAALGCLAATTCCSLGSAGACWW
jgi:hypothetical protein